METAFSREIRGQRLARGFKFRDLAEALSRPGSSVSPGRLCRWEKGGGRPRLAWVERLAAFYGAASVMEKWVETCPAPRLGRTGSGVVLAELRSLREEVQAMRKELSRQPWR